jgi:hypothetical protein
MRAALALVAAVLVSGAVAEDVGESAVPAVVRDALKKAYPNAARVEWEKQKSGNFEAEFKSGKQQIDVTLAPSGEILETDMEITAAELPQAVRATLDKQFAGQKVKEAEKVDKGGTTVYEVELAGKTEVVVSADGTIVKKKAGDEGDEDKGEREEGDDGKDGDD